MTLFHYPTQVHVRRLNPPQYKGHRKYKPVLRKEFKGQCVYCRMPDWLKGTDNFGVDHYQPQSLFPCLRACYGNLYYACNPCNRRKGKFSPTNKQKRAGLFIPNPCDHIMGDHLKFDAARVQTLTRTGQFAEEILILNHRDDVIYRQGILDTIFSLKASRDDLRQMSSKLQMLSSSRDKEKVKRIIEQRLRKIENSLSLLIGERQ